MRRKFAVKAVVLFALCSLVATGLVTSAGAGTSSGGSGGGSLLPATGKCDKKLEPIGVATQATYESPELSNLPVIHGMEAAVAAFNKKYGGVGGHCIDWTGCDEANDAAKADACVRKILADTSIVMNLNDVIVAGGQADAQSRLYGENKYPRMPSPSINDFSSAYSYLMVGGGFGGVIMSPVPLLKAGAKKLYLIGVDTPQLGAVPGLLKPLTDSYGATYVGVSKVPGGTTDYQQFILAAEDAGADGITISLGLNEANQVLKAAGQLGTDIPIAMSIGNVGSGDVKDLGEIADQMVFSADLPPADGSTKRWPLLKNLVADYAASKYPELKKDRITNASSRSWFSVYFFKKIMEEYADPDNLTRESVTAAMNAAQAVDSGGAIPGWTPNTAETFLAFNRLSNPWYYDVTWNGKKFVVADDMWNLIREFKGEKTYAQPAAS